jgi:UTP---glucose-1-phosphate uridylyltransferase
MIAASNLKAQIIALEELLASLKNAETYSDKLTILDALPVVQNYFQRPNAIFLFLKKLTPEGEFAIKSIVAIGQAPVVFNLQSTLNHHFNKLVQLLEQLLEIEIFYQHIGGIIGYHLMVISLIDNQQKPAKLPSSINYIHPEGLHLAKDDVEAKQAVRRGVESLEHLAAIYPLGGAGDRLNLTDDVTGVPLPAACLPFLGRTLLEGLIRDLQALEYLSFKLFGKQHITPIGIMTSVEKNNHIHILNICKDCQWFGRPSDSFYFFIQPIVPVITMEGNWSMSDLLTLTLKPCGHGVLWKLAEEQGFFTWLEAKGRHQCLIRQINNPLAGTDNTLLALVGIGHHEHKAFGFASCERLINSDEGTNVLIETHDKQGYDYRLTNIEYTDFTKRGINELPAKPGSNFSIYPANTNILFADIPSIRKTLKVCPIPGQLVNMKSKVSYIDSHGQQSYVYGGRLESTMQNIADFIVDHFDHELTKEECKHALQTFIVYNTRVKTISTTKKCYKEGESPVSTPEQAYYDLLTNNYALLKQCQFELPEWINIDEYLLQGPPCILIFQPALGPLYSIITQKIRKGRLIQGAELQLEIAEVDIEDLTLEGSLLIEALAPLGIHDTSGLLQYGQESRCSLKHVTVRNKGIDRHTVQHYWKNDIKREEQVKIILHEGAEFHAENITLIGPHSFEVPAYHRLVLEPHSEKKWTTHLSPIQKPTWSWKYTLDSQNNIQLERN